MSRIELGAQSAWIRLGNKGWFLGYVMTLFKLPSPVSNSDEQDKMMIMDII
jgi:hypothetical protein